jgi:ABC-type microcin C transport system permease subunit YejE
MEQQVLAGGVQRVIWLAWSLKRAYSVTMEIGWDFFIARLVSVAGGWGVAYVLALLAALITDKLWWPIFLIVGGWWSFMVVTHLLEELRSMPEHSH